MIRTYLATVIGLAGLLGASRRRWREPSSIMAVCIWVCSTKVT